MHILAYASQACSVGDRGSAMQSCDWSLLLIGLAAENHSKASGRALVCVCGVIFKVCCMSLQSCISYQVLEFQDLAKSWIARTWFILVNYFFRSPTFDQFGFELSNELGPKGQNVLYCSCQF